MAVKFRLFYLVLAFTSAFIAQATHAENRYHRAVSMFADGIAEELNRAADSTTPLRVAIWPFEAESIPVSTALADEINARLLGQLIPLVSNNVTFVARRELSVLIADIQSRDAWRDTAGNPVAQLLQSTGDVDILIIGAIRLDGQSIHLRYDLVRRDGTLIAALAPHRIVLSKDTIAGAGNLHTLESAMDIASRELFAQAPGLHELHLGGVYFQDSGLQPAFGRFLEEQITTSLQRAVKNELTGQSLSVTDTRLSEKITSNDDGTTPVWPAASWETTPEKSAAYELRGSYWDFGSTIEIRFQLSDPMHQQASWRGRIRKENVGNIEFRPPQTAPATTIKQRRPIGPIALSMTTARGANPIYRLGDRLHLLLRMNRPGWVYCFYEQSDGRTVQILPNPISLRSLASPRLDGDTVYAVPGRTLFPFNLVFIAPPGYERVRCFAADRDIENALPTALNGRNEGFIPAHLAASLSEIFGGISGAAITEQSVAITVIKEDQ